MLENSFGLIFFLKAPRHNESNIRSVYFRITVDGIPKEAPPDASGTLSAGTRKPKEQQAQKKMPSR